MTVHTYLCTCIAQGHPNNTLDYVNLLVQTCLLHSYSGYHLIFCDIARLLPVISVKLKDIVITLL